MAKYRVFLNAVVSTAVEVEAEDGDSAVDAALERGVPGLMFLDHTYPDVGDCGTPSDLFPESSRPEDDYEAVEEI